jgi:cytochrome c oxidase cbb3-type subunit III
MAEPNGKSRPDRDAHSGRETTGHEWDGIRELDTPLPRWWLWTFYASIAFSVVYVVLYPAWPLVHGATTGVLGYSTRDSVEEALADAKHAQSGNLERVTNLSLDEISADPDLKRFAVAGGRSAFLVNCVQCHGSGAAGSPGFPNLNDDDWLWGGSLDVIQTTIMHGVRFGQDADTRISEMPAFGGGALASKQIEATANFVLSLSNSEHNAALAAEGKQIFADNCAACHGETGGGNREFGAPSLSDAISLYGNDHAAIVAQITKPRHGVMPAWAHRLNPVTIKQLTLYVHSLGGGEAAADNTQASAR